MRILYSIHLYPPKHNCGGEYFIHNLNKFLIAQGHEVRVVLQRWRQDNVNVPYHYEGVDVIGGNDSLDTYRWADVIVTHLDFTHFTLQVARAVGKPCVHIVHNHHNYQSVENAPDGCFVVYNSEWIKKKLNYKWPSVVIHPPVDYRKYDTGKDAFRNKYITMINLNTNKGGRVLQRVASVMRDKFFLGVCGSYDKQITEQPGNVKVLPNSPDIMPVYEQTRVLLMPSQYESWGMTATEAMCSGIPVVCTPTPGLKENCDYAGVYVQRRRDDLYDDLGNVLDDTDEYNIDSIVRALRALEDEKYYRKMSELSRKRSRELDPQREMKMYEDFLFQARGTKLKVYV